MRYLLALAASFALASAPLCGQNNVLSPEERSAGWQLLFNGADTTGWHRAAGGPVTGVQIEDGVLLLKKSEHHQGDIVTDRVFGDSFELSVDFNIEEGGNSGIKYFVNDAVNTAAKSVVGFEYQVLDDERHPDAKLGRDGDRKTASLYDLLPAHTGGAYRGPGVWNTARIVVHGTHGEHWINGVKVLDYDRASPAFQAAFAQSKFRDFAGFGKADSGHFLLQDHGDTVRFRNVKVLESRQKPR